MITLPIRPRTLRNRLAFMAFGAVLAGATLGTGISRADGYINGAEAAYIEAHHSSVCAVIPAYPSEAGVLGVMQAIIDAGFSADSAVDVINASVAVYCDEWWPLLVVIGQNARAGQVVA